MNLINEYITYLEETFKCDKEELKEISIYKVNSASELNDNTSTDKLFSILRKKNNNIISFNVFIKRNKIKKLF